MAIRSRSSSRTISECGLETRARTAVAAQSDRAIGMAHMGSGSAVADEFIGRMGRDVNGRLDGMAGSGVTGGRQTDRDVLFVELLFASSRISW